MGIIVSLGRPSGRYGLSCVKTRKQISYQALATLKSTQTCLTLSNSELLLYPESLQVDKYTIISRRLGLLWPSTWASLIGLLHWRRVLNVQVKRFKFLYVPPRSPIPHSRLHWSSLLPEHRQCCWRQSSTGCLACLIRQPVPRTAPY